MLKERVLSAIALIAVVFAALFFFSPFYFALVLGAVVMLAVWEWTQFAHFKLPFLRLGITVVISAFFFLWIYDQANYLSAARVFEDYIEPLLLASVIWWLVALFFVIRYPATAKIWSKNKFLQFIFAFLTLTPFFLGVLRLRLDHYVTDPYHGIMLLLYVFILVWSADSGAYFSGRKFGKHKLAPKVSPGKTWEGVIGGLITATVLATIFVYFMPSKLVADIAMTEFVLLSIGTVAVSILGDLTESMFKRESGIKDSSHLIPGHGGILDRIDSLTAAVPFFAYFYFFVL
ncbi:phosphatidate cytidylyltransferase [Pasteurella dagmatis]|uniref:Phosphatidate cytidylyltransferase n=1 Tax=Pasteurella dagmatis ATCC 43325 TaxID=667128 RepID=C9PNE3_9PAST|nr:phosphatidate cytidylyltransferase [Pasteurella dagmatis]EEX50930.1 phosphatidate cytidylyltransferase [Pasteurella dagmatis ATCC 43325]SNV73275.1 phosphatidate cytidylyltransferase [Pasteurella dagmatis]